MKLKVLQTYENVEYVNAPLSVFNFLGLKIRQTSKYNVLYSDALTPVVLPYTDTTVTLPYNVWTDFNSVPRQKIQITSNISECYMSFFSGIDGNDGEFLTQGNLTDWFYLTYGEWDPMFWPEIADTVLWIAFGPDGTFWLKNKLVGNSPIQLTLRYFDPE